MLCTVNTQHRLDLYIRVWSSVESVVAALIEASLFPVLLLTCSLLIIHLASLRSCSAVHDSSKQVPGNRCGPKCTWWKFWSCVHASLCYETSPKSKVRWSLQQGHVLVELGPETIQSPCFCRVPSTTSHWKEERKFCINLFHLLHYVVSLWTSWLQFSYLRN